MKTTINQDAFIHNTILKDAFSYDARVALFEYLEEFESNCGIELDFHPIALRCEYTEYIDLNNVSQNYLDVQDLEDDGERLEWLQNHTIVIVFDGGIILQDF